MFFIWWKVLWPDDDQLLFFNIANSVTMVVIALFSAYFILNQDDLFSNDLSESKFIFVYGAGILHFIWIDAVFNWKFSRMVFGLPPPKEEVEVPELDDVIYR